MVVILVDNEEARLVCDFKEFDALSFNRLVPSVPDLGGILSRESSARAVRAGSWRKPLQTAEH
jgi:hypothetical protein